MWVGWWGYPKKARRLLFFSYRIMFSKLSRRTKAWCLCEVCFVFLQSAQWIGKTCQSMSEELLSFLPYLSCISCLHLKCLFFWHRKSEHNGKKMLSEAKSKNLMQCRLPLLILAVWWMKTVPSGYPQEHKYGSYWNQQLLFLTLSFFCVIWVNFSLRFTKWR